MNKRYVLAIYLAAALRLSAQAQTDTNGQFGPPQIISTQTEIAEGIYAADLDGDGDQDVLSASRGDNKIAWYENDGKGAFGEQQIISQQAVSAQDVYATDLDGDGDQDVLSASGFGETVAWYENDGEGNFGEKQIIAQADYFLDVYAADLDEDGDQDVLSASDNRIAWYENDGQGNFEEQVITTQVDGAREVYAADLDGDGDMDALSASFFDGQVAWYENDGQGNFGEQRIFGFAEGTTGVYAADLDGDGDQDVLSCSNIEGAVVWYENDGEGNFEREQYITLQAVGAENVYAADLDRDGDLDVVLASSNYRFYSQGNITWYENKGNGNFGEQQFIVRTTSAQSVYTADLDGDGDQDVLAASSYYSDGVITWYENSIDQVSPVVSNFTLVNNNTDADLRRLENGDAISLNELGSETFTVRADVSSAGERIRRVEFSLASPLGRVIRSEYATPYSLFSDNRGDYFGRKAIAGEYTLTATPYYLNSTGEEIAGTSNTIRFTFTDGARPVVNSFTLVNNNTDEDIQALEDGDEVSLEDITTFTVRANVLSGQQRVRRVEFRLDAPAGRQGALRSEYAAPYSLFSDDRGDYFGREAYAGKYKLTATPYYVNSAGKEIAGTSETIRFTFTDSQGNLAASAGIAYPVPFNETLTLRLGAVDMSQTQIQFVHGYGKVYQVSASQMSQDAQGLVLNLAQLPSGPYTVRVMNAGQVQTFRVSKE